jgi:hypothetical protein
VIAVARVSSVAGAIAWLLGLPIAALSAVIPSDAEYFWEGVVGTIVGLAIAPLALVYVAPSSTSLTRLIQGSGMIVSAVLVFADGLLVLAAMGYVGEKAPSWIPSSAGIGLVALALWILLASISRRDSNAPRGAVFWLGVIAAVTLLCPLCVAALIFLFDPRYVSTDATIPLEMLVAVAFWWFLPIWLIAVAVSMAKPVTP